MASLRDYRSDVLLLLQKSKISKDFRVQPRHIDFLIHRYRAIEIRQQYSKTLEIDPTWLQDMGPMPVTNVTSGDDPIITISSVTLGKINIPTVVQLPNNAGVYRIATASKQTTIYPITQPRFFELVRDSYRAKFCYWFKVGNSIYSDLLSDWYDPILILDNPLDGTIHDTTNKQSGELIVGQQYKVVAGTIVHNSIQYNVPATFTAVNKNFLGTGNIQAINQVRPMTEDDQYPMSFTLAERIVLKILTQDFKIEENKIGDLRNDSNDQLTVLQGEKNP